MHFVESDPAGLVDSDAFTREVRALAMVLRPEHAEPSAAGELDWPRVTALALRHSLAPLLFYQARRTHREIPAREFHALWEAFGISLFLSGRVLDAARSVVGALRAADVRCLALKGLHLATAFYSSPSLRPMADLDLLIQRDQLHTARKVLLDLGYAPMSPGDKAEAHHLPTLAKSGTLPVELHWSIERANRRVCPDIEGMWERAGPSPSPLLDSEVFCAEDLLLHLCLHATYHHRCRVPLRSIVDIDVVLNRVRNEISWDGLIRAANLAHAEKPVFCGLLLTHALFGTEVPACVLECLASGADRAAILRSATAQLAEFDLPAALWLSELERQPTFGKRVGTLVARASWFPPGAEEGSRDWTWPYQVVRGLVKRGYSAVGRHHKLLWGLVRSRPDARARVDAAHLQTWLERWFEEAPGPPAP